MTKRNEITYRIFVDMSGEDVPWESLSSEKQKEISVVLNDKAMQAAGYKRKDKTV